MNITGGDMKVFRKVASVMADHQGLIDGADLIAAFFLMTISPFLAIGLR
ncbi:msl8073 [Mesorhizobium japonicum MAFF 303099]|uniref:Msl8073 protein n=1 Tax=Mesorhizobium japonicum (strain LMG 29417 / CECT 9101 / MAFF 303099) TaxID=266835 RepID=Q984B7_RHILO|nr:msl8073 [Mesorhizobium japonicum MAFF 303099]